MVKKKLFLAIIRSPIRLNAVFKLTSFIEITKIPKDEISSYFGSHFHGSSNPRSPLSQKSPSQNLVTNAFECYWIHHCMWTISTTWIAKNEKGKDDNFKDNRKENRNGKCQKSTKMALLRSLSFVEIKNEIKNGCSNYLKMGPYHILK